MSYCHGVFAESIKFHDVVGTSKKINRIEEKNKHKSYLKSWLVDFIIKENFLVLNESAKKT